MDPKHDGAGLMLAPGAGASASTYVLPGRERSPTPVPTGFPNVDDHLVQPEVSREEIIRGRKILTMGANPEHAEAHTRTDFVLAPHVKPGYVIASDLLTRASQASNFATDVCIRKEGIDPETGRRYLEELSFEIVNEQSNRDVLEKAQDLTARGVRRFIAIFVKKAQVREWAPTLDEFVPLDNDGMFEDRLLIRPISIRALLDQAQAEVAVAQALIKKNNPEIAKLKRDAEELGHKKGLDRGFDEGHKKGLDKGFDEGRKRGELLGRRAFLCELLEDQFGAITNDVRSRIENATIEQIQAWSKRLRSATSADEVFATES